MLSISFSGMLWTVVNLLVLYVLMKKFLWGPVTAVIESRQKEIDDNLAGAEARSREAESKLEEYDQKLAHAGQEAAETVARAKERGAREYQAILAQAHADAAKVQQQAQRQAGQERREMLQGARREVASLALLCAAKVAGRELDADADRAMVEEFLNQDGDGI